MHYVWEDAYANIFFTETSFGTEPMHRCGSIVNLDTGKTAEQSAVSEKITEGAYMHMNTHSPCPVNWTGLSYR